MRSMTGVGLALAAALIATPAAAQTSFSIAAGATVPVGSTADAVDVGYNAILGLGIKPPLAPLGLRIEGMYNSHAVKDGGGSNMQTLAAIVNGTLSGVGMPIPMGYLIAGLGMYSSKLTDVPIIGNTDSETDIGFNIGAGINIPLTGFSTFLEARFHFIQTEGNSTKLIPISFGIKF